MNTQNLVVTSTFIYFVSIVALIFQIIISNTFIDITCIFILFITNILTIYYCFNKKYFFEYPISLLMIFFSNMMSSGGALYLKSFELSIVTEKLQLPLSTIIVLCLFNLFIIISHIIYRNSFTLNKITKLLNNFYLKHNLIEINNINFLYILGMIGILCRLFYYDLNVTREEQVLETGPSLIQDLMKGFSIFIYAPVIILFSKILYNTPHDNKKNWFFLLYIVFVIFISLATNSRSVVYDVIFLFGTIYFLLLLLGFIKINRAFYIKLIIFVLLFFPALNILDNISQAYVLERATRLEKTPVESFKSFLNNISFDKVEKKTHESRFMDKQTFFVENYYQNTLFNRINFLLINDNFHYIGKEIGKAQLKNITEHEIGKIISILPQPVINLFTSKFDKRDYISFSNSSYIYHTFSPIYTLAYNIGSMLMSLYMHFGYWIFIIILLSCLPVFIFFDSFYNKKLLIISPIILLYFFGTSRGVVNFLATTEFSVGISFLFRDIPQTMILYFILSKLYLFFTKKV